MAKRRVDNRWNDVRTVLASHSSVKLADLVRNLYNLSQENRDFLNARYLPSQDRLGPYKKMIDESIYPDMYSNKPIRISAAKKAISQYAKATNDKAGTLELMVYFVERGTQFTVNYGDIHEAFYSSLESMFGRVLDILKRNDPEVIERFLPRLTAIRDNAAGIGWGYHDYLRDALLGAFPSVDEDVDKTTTTSS